MKFVCDTMLGKLAKYLRLLGLDTIYLRDLSHLTEIRRSEESWIFITRRTRFAGAEHTVLVRSEVTRQQVTELKDLLKRFVDRSKILNRCIECNVPLADADRAEIEHIVPEFVFHHYKRFKKCPSCNRVYWEGSHARHMSELLEELLAQ